MQNQAISQDNIKLKKRAFLILFSKELIKKYNVDEITKLKKVLDDNFEERKKRELEILKKRKLINSSYAKKAKEIEKIPIRIKEENPIKNKREVIVKKPQNQDKKDYYPEREKIFEKNLREKAPPKRDFSLREKIESGLEIKNPVKIKSSSREIEDSLKPPRPGSEEKVLKIPEPQLPERFQYLNPTPTKKQIDLGKLNPLLQDPGVRIIECEGADERIFVTGTMGKKPTKIVLSEQEINDIIQRFSEEAKIPVHEGVFRIVVGNWILSSVVSDIAGSRFILKRVTNKRQTFYNQ